jgi:Zn-dependent metalloprotease
MLGFLVVFTNAQTPKKSFKSLNKSVTHAPVSFKATLVNGKQSSKTAFAVKSNAVQVNPLPAFNLPNTTGDTKIIKSRETGTPLFIERKTSNLKSTKIQTPNEKCFEFLESIKQDMQIEKPSESFQITDIKEDNLGQQHIRLNQKYKGVKVYNADFYVHFTSQNELLNGRYFSIQQNIATKPDISKEGALETALSDLRKITTIQELTAEQKILLNYETAIIDTVILKSSSNAYNLAYYITIRPNFIDEWKYFIDAQNNTILNKYNNTANDGPATANAMDLNGVSRSINTYLEAGKYYLIDAAESMFNSTTNEGMIITLDAQNTSTAKLSYIDVTSANNTWSNPTAVSAHYNAAQTFKYLKNTFNRNSINGKGGNILSLINVADENGQGMDNAFWNGAAIFYGNGNTAFKPLAGALDVAAHEIGHGITGNTAALEYQGESGAMNEAYSDIFGAMVDRANWYIGESVTKTSYIATGRLRDMSAPHNDGANGWQPSHTSEMYKGTDDNGGVHINSGIVNFAYYKYATALTKEKAEQVFYRALTTYLTKSSQFVDLRIAIIQSASDLYGANSNEVNQAKTAFDAVGIYDEPPVVVSKTYPVNPGQDYIFLNNTDATDLNILYKSTTDASAFTPLSTTKTKGKASIVDDGSYAVYVSDDSKIRSVTLGSTPSESTLSNEAIWDNVAISRDGKRLAAITTDVDSSIYVYDYVSAKWTRYMLFNPTTQEGVVSYNVLYADAIEFDHTGEYLIYDAYNSLNSTSGTDINYWDIGLLKVWDNKTNKAGDGSIMKLYGSLPENVSIGNPTFSKNSPNIIAFDYFDATSYAILGLNLETFDLGKIADNNALGFPSYSKLDDKVAYSSLNGSSRPIINEVALKTDKITFASSPATIITEGEWPVYYATGTRVLGFSPLADFTVSYKTGSAPFTAIFTDNSKYDPTSWEWTFEGGNPSTSTLQNPTVTYNSLGNFAVTLKVTNSFGNNTLLKSGYIVVTDVKNIISNEKPMRIHPNPVKDILVIEHSPSIKNDAKIYIYTVNGNLLETRNFEESINVSNLKSGMYILKIASGTETTQIKMIKE